MPIAAASAATSIDGPIDLGTAAPFGVLAHTTVTNANISTLKGDVGLSPGTDVTGFPPGILNGTLHQTDAVAAQAKVHLTTAYGVAASLTPTPTYAVSSGSLPAGLTLDSTTGVISGQPTTPGTHGFDITASNGASPAATETYSIVVAAAGDELADTGADAGTATLAALGVVTIGSILMWGTRRRATT